MRKFRELAGLFIGVVVTQLLLFIMIPLPSSIVSMNLVMSGIHEYKDALEGIVYFFTYNVIIIFCLSFLISTTKKEAFQSAKKTFIQTLLPLFGIYLAIDIIRLLAANVFPLEFQAQVFLLLHTLYTIIAFVIINRSLRKTITGVRETNKVKHKAPFYSVFILILSSVFICYTFFCLNKFNELDMFFEKYSFGGYINTWGISSNMSFQLQLINLIYNILICSGLTIIFSGYLFTEPKEKEKISPKPIIIIASLFLVFIGIEVFLLPQDNMYLAENPYNYIDENEVKDDFSTDYSIFAINRESAFSPVAFQSKTTTINYKNEKIRSFSTASGAGTDEFEKLDTKQSTAYRYNDEALVYLDKGEPKVILSTELNQQEENEVLTEVLEATISEGYFVFLENSCEYMLKYDKDFIVPYIERYAKGDLTEAEQEINGYINMDYMQNFAQNIDVN